MSRSLVFGVEPDDDDEEQKPTIPEEPISETRVKVLTRTKIALLFIHLACAIAQFVLSQATDLFTFQANVVKLARTDALVDSSGTPGLEIVEVGPLVANVLFSATNLFAAMAYLFALFYNTDELLAISAGKFQFVWLVALFGLVPMWFAVELTAGVAAWTELFALGGAAFAWTFVYWIGTYSRAFDASRLFSWTFLVVGFGLQALIWIVSIYAGAVKTMTGGPAVHLLPVIVACALDLAYPIAIVVAYSGIMRRHTSLVWLYVAISFDIVLVSWLAHTAYAVDGITYP